MPGGISSRSVSRWFSFDFLERESEMFRERERERRVHGFRGIRGNGSKVVKSDDHAVEAVETGKQRRGRGGKGKNAREV